MDDTKHMIDNEYPLATEDPKELQPPNEQHMGHAPPPYGDTAVTVQPGPAPTGVSPRPAWDEPNIKTGSIISIVISSLALFCGCAIFCAVPGLIMGALALGHLHSDPDRARSYANAAKCLTVIATVFGLINLGLTIWYYCSAGDYGY